MKYYRYWIILFTALFFFVGPLINCRRPPDQKFVSASRLINRQKVFHELKRRSMLPVIFPTKIPVPESGEQPLYVSFNGYRAGNSDYSKFWQINIDATPTCGGVRICNVGFLSAQKHGIVIPDYQTLPGNKNYLKEKVLLPGNITGYYTPFHIQAGGVNPTLEWRVNNILYTLSWRIDAPASQQKQIFIETGSYCRPEYSVQN